MGWMRRKKKGADRGQRGKRKQDPNWGGERGGGKQIGKNPPFGQKGVAPEKRSKKTIGEPHVNMKKVKKKKKPKGHRTSKSTVRWGDEGRLGKVTN